MPDYIERWAVGRTSGVGATVTRLPVLVLSALLFIGGIAIVAAQVPMTGAGRGAPGGGSCVAPDLTANWAHWDATDSYVEASGTPTTPITVDETAIGSWKDLGPSGNHAYAVGGTGPHCKTNVLNAKPSARFDGAVNQMLTTAAPASNAFSIFAVANQTVIGTNYDGLITADDLSPRFSILTNGPGNQIRIFNNGNGAIENFPATAYHLIAATIDNSGMLETTLKVDNNATVTANAPGAGNTAPVSVGKYFNGYWAGDVLAIIVNLAIQSPTTGVGLCNRQHLNSRYGLGLAI